MPPIYKFATHTEINAYYFVSYWVKMYVINIIVGIRNRRRTNLCDLCSSQ